jgi:succinate dehydrogenase / fumarate reductase iron-sulfur subunit
MHPTGAHLRHQRLDTMMGEGGIHECSYAGNCVQICPKNIPLTTSISIVNGQVISQAIGDLLQKPEVTSANKKPGHR